MDSNLMGLDELPTTRTDRRPELDRLGPRGAAPLARGRAQVAAPLPEGPRGRHRLRHRLGRPRRAAHRALADPPGRRRARAGRPAGARRSCCAPARRRCSAASPSRSRSTPSCVADLERASFAPARLPGAPARRQARSRRCRCSRSTARCRRRSRPSASIRPTSGRSTGAGARSRTIPTSSPRQADADVRAAVRSATCSQLMRGTQALDRARRR